MSYGNGGSNSGMGPDFMDLMKQFGIGTGSQDMMDQLSKIMQMYQQMNQQGTNRLAPYNQAGQDAIPKNQQFNDYINKKAQDFDPQKSVDNMVAGYKETPYAKYYKQQALDQMQNGAAMSGQLGGGQNIRDYGEMADTISNKFQQDYMNNVQNQQHYGMDLNNLDANMFNNQINTGQNAANNTNTFQANMGKNMADVYKDQGTAQGAQDSSMFGGLGDIGGMLSKLFSFF